LILEALPFTGQNSLNSKNARSLYDFGVFRFSLGGLSGGMKSNDGKLCGGGARNWESVHKCAQATAVIAQVCAIKGVLCS
jgi:hypothetical protein